MQAQEKPIGEWMLSDLAAIKKKGTIALGTFTKKETRLASTLTQLETAVILPSVQLSEDLQVSLQDINTATERLDYLYTSILNIDDLPQADKTACEGKEADVQRRYKALQKRVIQAYSMLSATPRQPAVQRTSKNRAECQPDPLKETCSPAVMLTWIMFFKAYFDSSHFELENIRVQHTVFLRNLEQDLRKKFETKLSTDANKTLPIFCPDPEDVEQSNSCMGLIIAHWKRNFPMLSKRLTIFRREQQNGEKFTDFLLDMTRMDRTADLHTMTGEEIFITLALKGCRDPHMLEKLQEIPDLKTRSQLEQKAQEIERQRQDRSSILPGSDVNALKSSYRKAQDHKMSPSAPTAKKTKTPRLPPSVNGLCLACGMSDHQIKNCPTKANESCTHCGKSGHNKKICLTLHREKQKEMTKDKPKNEDPPQVNKVNQVENMVNTLQVSENMVNTLQVSDTDPNMFEGMFEARL